MLSRSDLMRLAAALNGIPVLGCLEGSPAAEAGVRYGDILLAVDGTPTSTWNEFIEARGRSRGRFTARVFRDGVELELGVELRPSARSPLDVLTEMIDARAVAVEEPTSDGPKN